VVAAIAVASWPVPGVSFGESLGARVVCVALAAVALAVMHLTRAGLKRVWLGAALAAAAAGGAAAYAHARTLQACVADYEGSPRIIGRELTQIGREYLAAAPAVDAERLNDSLLFDGAGDTAAVWTSASIESCRSQVTWSSMAPIPLFAIAAGALIATARRRFAIAPPGRVPVAAAASGTAPVPVYDAFMSYRHGEPDASYAAEIVQTLEARGFRVAIDYRDFVPSEHFLAEIERCIKTSRFILCVVTARYVASDHTTEEAIIARTIDLSERQKRVVPLIFERVELPVWLYGLSGVDCTSTAPVDPLERVIALLSAASKFEVRKAK
jgi:hypothetical protein